MQNTPRPFKLSTISQVVSLICLSLGAVQPAWAQSTKAPTDLGTIGASTAAGAYRPDEAAKNTASSIAPSQASLQATQPQSIITREFIDLYAAPTADYSRIVNFAPGLSGSGGANGPGLSETKTIIRGFSDDQTNVTFDGIPFADTNNPAHHSTAYFPASIIGGAVVERGPGNASNLGYATFGGSINLFSQKPSEVPVISVFGTVGTWNTRLIGASYESGRLADWGDATLQLNYQKLESDGYLTKSPIRSDNFTLKFERPVGDSSLMTVFTSINSNKYFQPDSNKGATLAQVAAFGKNFQLTDTPNTMNFYGNNFTVKDTDFSYLRLRTDWGQGWNTDNQFYSYAYNNQTTSTTSPTGDNATFPIQTGSLARVNAVVPINGNIPGIDKQNKYRAWGDIFKATKKMEAGLLRAGLWWERSVSDRHQYDMDLTTGLYSRSETAFNGNFLPGTNRPIDSVLFDQQSSITTAQPFAEFEWAVGKNTTVTPGLKYVIINRSVSAAVEQTTRELGHNASLDYTATLPFLTVNHKFNPGMSVYGQYAQGMQIPDLNTFYISKPGNNSTDPQKSTNYQLGIVGKSDRMTWDADLYRIEFTNKLVSNNLAGANAGFVNIGGATYQGIEGQMAYVVGSGFSAYANASLNDAKASSSGEQILSAPYMTAALGGLYGAGAWTGSLLYKYVGATRQKDFDSTKAPIAGQPYYDYYQTAGYGTMDLGVAYTLKNTGSFGKAVKVQLNVFNLLDSQAVTSISTGKTVAFDTYVYQPARSYQLSLKADF